MLKLLIFLHQLQQKYKKKTQKPKWERKVQNLFSLPASDQLHYPPQSSVSLPSMLFINKTKLRNKHVKQVINMLPIEKSPPLQKHKGKDKDSKTKNESQLHTLEIPVN